MPQYFDAVTEYGHALGWELRPRTIIVEGTTDVNLFHLAARFEFEESGIDLFGNELAVIAAGERDRGGTRGVCRELICLRGIARTTLLPNGRPLYRFIGLFDNDKSGIEAVRGIRNLDASILEYKDVFRLMPNMPHQGNLDPKTLGKTFDRLNTEYKGLDWELEDLLSPEFVDSFVADHPTSIRRSTEKGGKIHRDFTPDGKARLHCYIRENVMLIDLMGVIEVIRAMRFYLCLPPI